MEKIYIVIIVICFMALAIMKCSMENSTELPPNVPTLQPNETSAVTIDASTNVATIQQRDDNGNVNVSHEFVPAESTYTVVTSTMTGKTEMKYKKKGFCLVPNITVTYNNQFSAGIGARLFYWNEFGIVSHLNYWFTDEKVSFSAGLDYRLYKLKLKNVAIGASYDTYKTIKAQINLYLG